MAESMQSKCKPSPRCEANKFIGPAKSHKGTFGTVSGQYRAIVCNELADDISIIKLEQRDITHPGPGEVRIAMRACAVNFSDILTIQGKYQHKPDLPFTPGTEGAGDIVEVGNGVMDWHVGDAVGVGVRSGGFAESITTPVQTLRPIPNSFSYEEAASFTSAYLTAYVALVRRGNVQEGETVLIHGAAGGVGSAAVEIAKILGATVIATASSDEKLEFARARGADHTINYIMPDGKMGGFREEVKALTDGQGADVIYDPVGGDVFDESLRCIAWGGRLLVIGFTSGRIATVPSNIPLIKGFSVVGVRAGEYGRRDSAKGAENLETINRWASEGRFRPHICQTFPLEQIEAALRTLEDRKALGKVVVTMSHA
jgi:NADPH2:quinone reductase